MSITAEIADVQRLYDDLLASRDGLATVNGNLNTQIANLQSQVAVLTEKLGAYEQVKNLRVQSRTATSFILQWDPIAGASSYEVYRGVNADGSGGWRYADSVDELQGFSGLTAGTVVNVAVAAKFSDGRLAKRSASYTVTV